MNSPIALDFSSPAQQTPKKGAAPKTRATKPKSPKIKAIKPKSPKAKTANKPKSPKKTKPAKVPSGHPPYNSMIEQAIGQLKEKKGSSRLAILKFIQSHYKLGDNEMMVNAHLKQALKRGVKTGALKQVKGIGASGSFRLGGSVGIGGASLKSPALKTKKKKSPMKKVAKNTEAKNPDAKKAEKPTARKAGAKKPKAAAAAATATAGSPIMKKAAANKSPKKVAAKKPKVPKKAGLEMQAKKTSPKKGKKARDALVAANV